MSMVKDMTENKEEIDWSEFHITPRQTIEIKEIPTGSVIDIGGGGEGVIGQIGGKRITSIDKLQSELEEARRLAPEAKMVVADATALPFQEAEFDNATSFFSGMYMTNEDKIKVLKETLRVIKSEGELWYWDANVQTDKPKFVISMTYVLPNGEAKNTGYGCKSKEQPMDLVVEMMNKVGFIVETFENQKYWYFIKARKP